MTDPSHNSYARTNHMVSKSTTLETNPAVPCHVEETENLEKTLSGVTKNARNNFLRRRKIEVPFAKDVSNEAEKEKGLPGSEATWET